MALVVINADDYGLSDGVCRAINELLDAGAVSNTTVMVTPNGATDRIRYWGGIQLRGKAGLHLTLTEGKPVSSQSDVPSLVDPATGEFWSRDSLVARSGAIDPGEVAREWERQFELARELLGASPTHLDSHHAIHRLPPCWDGFISLAMKHHVPVRGGGPEELAQKVKAAHIGGSTFVVKEWTAHSQVAQELIDSLKATTIGIGQDDVIEVVSHPGYVDDYLIAISTLNMPREDDRIALHQLADQHMLARNGFTLVKYPHLK